LSFEGCSKKFGGDEIPGSSQTQKFTKTKTIYNKYYLKSKEMMKIANLYFTVPSPVNGILHVLLFSIEVEHSIF